MTNFIMSSQAVWLEAIERRIEATTAMLGSMKGIKMCGLTDVLLTNIHNLRLEELKISKKFRRLLTWNLAFGTLHFDIAFIAGCGTDHLQHTLLRSSARSLRSPLTR